MIVLTRLWHGVVRSTRTMTLGRLAAAYVVAVVLGLVGVFLAQAVALTSGSQPGLGAWLMISVGSVMLWGSILIFVGASIAGLVRLVRSLAGR